MDIRVKSSTCSFLSQSPEFLSRHVQTRACALLRQKAYWCLNVHTHQKWKIIYTSTEKPSILFWTEMLSSPKATFSSIQWFHAWLTKPKTLFSKHSKWKARWSVLFVWDKIVQNMLWELRIKLLYIPGYNLFFAVPVPLANENSNVKIVTLILKRYSETNSFRWEDCCFLHTNVYSICIKLPANIELSS